MLFYPPALDKLEISQSFFLSEIALLFAIFVQIRYICMYVIGLHKVKEFFLYFLVVNIHCWDFGFDDF